MDKQDMGSRCKIFTLFILGALGFLGHPEPSSWGWIPSIGQEDTCRSLPSSVKVCYVCLCCICLAMHRCVAFVFPCLPKVPDWSNTKLNGQ